MNLTIIHARSNPTFLLEKNEITSGLYVSFGFAMNFAGSGRRACIFSDPVTTIWKCQNGSGPQRKNTAEICIFFLLFANRSTRPRRFPTATRCHEGQTWKPHYEGSFDGLTRIYTFDRVKKCRGSPATSVSRGRADTENQFTRRSTKFDVLNRPWEKNNYLSIGLFQRDPFHHGRTFAPAYLYSSIAR